MIKSTRFIILLVLLTGCDTDMSGGTISSGSNATSSPVIDTAINSTVSQSQVATCKSLESSWTTSLIQNSLYSPTLGTYPNPAVPQNVMLGIEPNTCIAPGHSCTGGTYTLDLTTLGSAKFTVKADYQTNCYYSATVGSASYVIETLNSCDTTSSCSGCSCCPYISYGIGNPIGEVFDYTLSCNSLSIIDTGTGQTETYQ